MAFKPDGSVLVVAYGRFLLLYDAATGDVLRSKEAHNGEGSVRGCARARVPVCMAAEAVAAAVMWWR